MGERSYQAADVYNATHDIDLYHWVASLERERDKTQNEASSALTQKRRRYEAALHLIAEGTDKVEMRAIARSALWPWGNPSGTLREAMRG